MRKKQHTIQDCNVMIFIVYSMNFLSSREYLLSINISSRLNLLLFDIAS